MSRGEHLTGFMCAAVIDLGVLVNTGSMGAILVEVWAEIGGASQPSGWLYAAQAACRVTSAPKGRQDSFFTRLGHSEARAILFRHGTGSDIRQGVHSPLRRQLLACYSDM